MQSPKRTEQISCFRRRKWLIIGLVFCISIIPFIYQRAERNTIKYEIPPTIPVDQPNLGLGTNPEQKPTFQKRKLQGIDEESGRVVDSNFLQEQLPIKVVEISPSTSGINQVEQPIMLSGRTAITVVFNRAVIRLGSDFNSLSQVSDDSYPVEIVSNADKIPGKFRWVTTSILRFDTDVDWPSDLFIEVRVKRDMKAYDGATLNVENSILSRRYKTSPLSFSIESISSKRASNYTDGMWSAFLSNPPEVPPDGEIYLQFSSPIDSSLIGKSLKLTKTSSSTEIPFRYESCVSSSSTCLKIYPEISDETDQVYKITLPKGSKYHINSGETESALSVEFSGLLSFKFRFVLDNFDQPKHFIYYLFLPHGLQDEVDFHRFESVLAIKTFSGTLDYVLSRPHKAILAIRANFEPDTEYTIHFSKSNRIIDGFGLFFQESSTTFTTAPSVSFFTSPHGPLLFEQSFVSDWKIIARSSDGISRSITAWNINETDPYITSSSYCDTRVMSGVEVDNSGNSQLKILNIKNKDLFGISGIGKLKRSYEYYSNEVAKTNYSVVIHKHRDSIRAWVTSMETGDPVSNLELKAFPRSYCTPNPSPIATGRTDVNGLVTFEGINEGVSFMTKDEQGRLAKVDEIWGFTHQNSMQLESTLFSERKLYRIGEDIIVKGVIRGFNMETRSIQVPSSTENVLLSIYWNPQKNSAITVSLDPIYGTFNATINIPSDADYGLHSINAQMGSKFFQTEILIADPRIPTAKLSLETSEKIIKPQSPEIPLKFRTETYSGSPVEAEFELKWRIERASVPRPLMFWDLPERTTISGEVIGMNKVALPPTLSSSDLSNDKGIIYVTTNADGNGTYLFKVPSNANPVNEGDTLVFDVEWISPSRETIRKDLKIPVMFSEWKIGVKLSENDPLPGISFGVISDLRDLNDVSILDKEISLNLYKWDEKTPLIKSSSGEITALTGVTPVTSCQVQSDGGKNSQCTITLPEIGKYVLIAASRDSNGYIITTAIPLGKTKSEWEVEPLREFPETTLIKDKIIYSIGETAKLKFYLPYNKARIWTMWGNNFEIKQQFSQVTNRGEQIIEIPIGEECKFGGCTVTIEVAVPRRTPTELPIQVPISPLFDMDLPRVLHLSQKLTVREPDSTIDLKITPKSPIVSPGTNTSVKVELKDLHGNPIEGEVTLWLVDQAVLDLSPIALRNLSEDLSFSSILSDPHISTTTNTDSLSSKNVYNKIFEIIKRRSVLNPWVQIPWLTNPPEFSVNTLLELSDEEFDKRLYTFITQFPGYQRISPIHFPNIGFNEFQPLRSANAPAVNEILLLDVDSAGNIVSPESPGKPAENSVEIRKNFMSTPFFGVFKVPLSGTLEIPIKLPDNIGTFVIRAVAVSKDNKYGGNEEKLISRRELTIQPSVPRVVRLGDSFQAGVTVQILPPQDQLQELKTSVEIQVEVIDEQSLQVIDGNFQKVSIPFSNPTEILFGFQAKSIGDSILRFTAKTSSQQDSMEITIPVLPIQEPVFVATSFAIQGSDSQDWSEGIQLPEAVAGTGFLRLEAGVGRLPSILLLSESIFSQFDYRMFGDTTLASVAPKGILQRYKGALTPNMRETLNSRFEKSISILRSFTTLEYGLSYYTPVFPYQRINCYLNAYGLLLDQFLKENNIRLPDDLVAMWRDALERGLVDLVQESRSYRSVFSDFNLIALSRLVLGSTWTSLDTWTSQDLSLSRLESSLDTCSTFCKATTGIMYIREKLSGKENLLKQITEYLTSSLRVQGRTAYITYSLATGSASAASLSTNSFSLIFLSNRNISNPLIEKLANYVAQQGGSSYSYSIDAAITGFSLSEYDFLKGSTNPSLLLTVKTETVNLLSERFDNANRPPVNRSLSWEDLGDSSEIKFGAIGKGEVSIALGLNFVPRRIFEDPVYRGIFVEKVIQAIDPFTHEAIGEPLSEFTPGKTVKVTIQVTSPDDLSQVFLVDLLPGGLEALDPNIYEIPTEVPTFGGYRCWWCWWSAFPSRQVRKDRVTFSSTWLFAGTHTVSYEALVVTSGNFTLPPAKAFVIEQPEVMGLSSGGKIKVLSRV